MADNQDPQEATGQAPESGAATAGPGEAGDAEPSVAELQRSLAEAHEALGTAQDQALRAAAETDNVRRRAAREVENAHKYALEKFAADLLPVLDSLEKAVESASTVAGAEAIAEGVSLSLKLFLDTLEKSGIVQLDPLGEPFNPEQHEAVAMVENPAAEPNTVMDVMQKGYLLNGRLVRAAMVVVVKAA